jgi:hypothetical protein
VEVIEPPSEEILERIRGEFGLNELQMREDLENVKEWIQM